MSNYSLTRPASRLLKLVQTNLKGKELLKKIIFTPLKNVYQWNNSLLDISLRHLRSQSIQLDELFILPLHSVGVVVRVVGVNPGEVNLVP